MTVADLIAKLVGYPPEQEVRVDDGDGLGFQDIDSVRGDTDAGEFIVALLRA